jgi:hypothetical protein
MALYMLSPSENQLYVFASDAFCLVVLVLKIVPAGRVPGQGDAGHTT